MKIYNPNFDKIAYFKTIRELNKQLKNMDLDWWRTWSEPRKATGYRTKLWHVGHGDQTEIVMYINKYYPKLKASRLYDDCVYITPRKGKFIKKAKTTVSVVATVVPEKKFKVGDIVKIKSSLLSDDSMTWKKFGVTPGMLDMVGKTYKIDIVCNDQVTISKYNFDITDLELVEPVGTKPTVCVKTILDDIATLTRKERQELFIEFTKLYIA